MNQQIILDKVIENCAKEIKQNAHPLVVFDLDSTLFDNGPRIHQILVEFCCERKLEKSLNILLNMNKTGLPYGMTQIFDQILLPEELEFRKEAMSYWFERFFSDAYQEHDVPVEGAVNYVKLIHQVGATVVYLSGRDSPGMLVGCSASLRTHNFPIGVTSTTLVLKPEFETLDLDFKLEAVDYIDRLGKVVATFDNEPGNCNMFLNKWPHAHHIWIDTNHHEDAPKLNQKVSVIQDFCSVG